MLDSLELSPDVFFISINAILYCAEIPAKFFSTTKKKLKLGIRKRNV